jgi:antirestriction protein ArdC
MLERSRCTSDSEYYSSLFHELVHATGHESRLNRKSEIKDKDEYALEELVAEMGAAMLCAHTGIFQEVEENVAAYCAGWIKKLKNDKHMLVKAGGRARKAVEYILGKEAQATSESDENNGAADAEKLAA